MCGGACAYEIEDWVVGRKTLKGEPKTVGAKTRSPSCGATTFRGRKRSCCGDEAKSAHPVD